MLNIGADNRSTPNSYHFQELVLISISGATFSLKILAFTGSGDLDFILVTQII